MAGFSVLCRLLCMAEWQQYHYCSFCRKPYRCLSHTRPGKMGVDQHNDVKPMSYHCFDCGTKVIQPSNFINQVAMILLFLMAMILIWWEFPGNRAVLLVIQLFVGIKALLVFRSSLAWSQKCKAIYDRWVMQHGTDPYNWPAATQPG